MKNLKNFNNAIKIYPTTVKKYPRFAGNVCGGEILLQIDLSRETLGLGGHNDLDCGGGGGGLSALSPPDDGRMDGRRSAAERTTHWTLAPHSCLRTRDIVEEKC